MCVCVCVVRNQFGVGSGDGVTLRAWITRYRSNSFEFNEDSIFQDLRMLQNCRMWDFFHHLVGQGVLGRDLIIWGSNLVNLVSIYGSLGLKKKKVWEALPQKGLNVVVVWISTSRGQCYIQLLITYHFHIPSKEVPRG